MGKGDNQPKDNFAVVFKVNLSKNTLVVDVIDGEALNLLVQSGITTTQVEVGNFNEALLAEGVPDEFLILDEKPYVVSELEKAISAKQASATVKDCVLVMPDCLKWAASKGITKINFDTMVGSSVNVRITVNPAKTPKGFATLANTGKNEEYPTEKMMDKFYSNQYALVEFLQGGSFGTTVHVAAKVQLGDLNANNLMFYHYDSFKNTMTQLQNTNHYIDGSGFLHFETAYGGSVVITDKPLAKK